MDELPAAPPPHVERNPAATIEGFQVFHFWLRDLPRLHGTVREPSTAKLSLHIPTLQEEGYRRDSIQLSEFLGLYLRIRNTETVVALTCRHVVVGPEELNIGVCHDPHNIRGIVQPRNKTYQDTPEFLRDQISRTQSAIDLRESSTPVPDKEIEYLRDYKAELESSLKRLEPFDSSPARFRDWALIELDQKKHQTPVKKLANKVPEMRHAIFGRPKFMLWQYVVPGRKRMHFSLAGCDTFTQTGVMPEAEKRCPDFEFAVTGKTSVDEEFMRVCMHGSASGGDSGASIMGDDGRVAAILTCGGSGALGGNRGIHDISYATPIEWLLEDIRGYGYDVEWMGKEIDLDYLHFRL
ncbi:hypothetical protein FAGAP_8741 [Fusarium agapanthi]|uniref:Peptidase S1 domain-containing protein n=1 Tax=Fusarium agapanthi TaxID=1803897 RepID=A0A9P5EC03_9HYPO|nr:hypothetical protein FAGAP_8741 [Fusarium agapanthi]